ncbi:MAG TPA: hypothetical protein VL201_05225 [Patescibacteria group bacterium]|nr:hypothetical protein [Patescibacteria group bacterium]
MHSRGPLQQKDILTLILRYAIAGQRYSDNLVLPKNDHQVKEGLLMQKEFKISLTLIKNTLFLNENPESISEKSSPDSIKYTKSLLSCVMFVNKLFYETTMQLLSQYAKKSNHHPLMQQFLRTRTVNVK